MVAEKKGGTIVWYDYDETGSPVGMRVNGQDYLFKKNAQGDIEGLYNSYGEEVVTYTYNSWGKVTEVSGDLASTVGEYNSLRYRGYYYDSDTGLYYLNSRYYDPETCRFVNADGYNSTGQGIIGNNMYAYCGYNPINRADTTGQGWFEVVLVSVAVIGCCALAVAAAPVLVTAAGVTTAATAVTAAATTVAIGATAVAVGAAGVGLYESYSNSKSGSKAKSEPKAIPKSKKPPSSGTVIYRYGGSNPGNLTPRKNRDEGTGLSFSTIPKPGSVRTTIEELNATGLVYAIRDGATHVSVKPVGESVETWIEEGSSSIWTAAVKSVVVKWDGGK